MRNMHFEFLNKINFEFLNKINEKPDIICIHAMQNL